MKNVVLAIIAFLVCVPFLHAQITNISLSGSSTSVCAGDNLPITITIGPIGAPSSETNPGSGGLIGTEGVTTGSTTFSNNSIDIFISNVYGSFTNAVKIATVTIPLNNTTTTVVALPFPLTSGSSYKIGARFTATSVEPKSTPKFTIQSATLSNFQVSANNCAGQDLNFSVDYGNGVCSSPEATYEVILSNKYGNLDANGISRGFFKFSTTGTYNLSIKLPENFESGSQYKIRFRMSQPTGTNVKYETSNFNVTAKRINLINVTSNNVCSGSEIFANVEHSCMPEGTKYKFYISNEYGDFANKTYLNTKTFSGTNSTSIALIIPSGLKGHSGYKIQAIAEEGNFPVVTSNTFTVTQQKISAATVTSDTICPGSYLQFNVSTNCPFGQGNSFLIELSNKYGSFDSPVIVGSADNILSPQTFEVLLPTGLVNGNGYKLRIKSTEPVDQVTSGAFLISSTTGCKMKTKNCTDVFELNLGADELVCATNQTKTIGVTNNYQNYKWNTGATSNTISVGPGKYWLEVTDRFGCKGRGEVSLVAFDPNATCGPTNFADNVTFGQKVFFNKEVFMPGSKLKIGTNSLILQGYNQQSPFNEIYGDNNENISLQTQSTGNVGIGTYNPDRKLTIEQNGDCFVGVRSLTGQAAISLSSGGTSQAIVRTPQGSGDIRFSLNGTDRLTITENGLVGIGTTQPTANLDVNGWGKMVSLNIFNEDMGSGGALRLGREADFWEFKGWNNVDNNGKALGLARFTNGNWSNTTYFEVRENGNMGIGVVNATENVEIARNLKLGGSILIANNSRVAKGELAIYNPNINGYLSNGLAQNGDLVVNSDNGNMIFELTNANADKNFKFVSRQLASGKTGGSPNLFDFETMTIKGNGEVKIPGKLHVGANAPTDVMMSVQGDAKVLGQLFIGTTKPNAYTDAKLTVAGNIAGQRMVVTNPANWSDFVFDKDYKLMSFDSLSTYVNQHKHLPNIPTQEEIFKEGYDLNHVDALLLQKIEELTLYILQLESDLRAIKNK